MDTLYNEEQKHLDETVEVIDDMIKDLEKDCESGIDKVREMSKYHWDNRTEMDDIEFALSRTEVNKRADYTNKGISSLRNLRRRIDKPFHGKIKVDFDGDEETFYIGKMNIMKNNEDIIVYDWRSPIAALYYNSKLGNTSYKAPLGMIDCKLLQRRQIEIEKRKIIRIIDSDVHLSDSSLQEMLSKNSSEKMRDIVATIQREQDEVIRDLEDKRIIVQGCAGSGKTSVALHRLSYLIYNDSKSTSENMLIFSPSDVFSSYISNVLPDLGDENVLQTTFSDFANAFVRKFDKLESYTEFVSKYYDGINDEEKNNMNKFKFSKEYKEALDKFIKNYVNSYRFKEDIMLYGSSISHTFLNKILENDNNNLQEKISVLTDEVCSLLKKHLNVKKSVVRTTIARELIKPEFDPKATYNKFLNSQEFIDAHGKPGIPLSKKLLEYPDLIGMLYLNFEFMGYPKNNIIHHLVIDEAQDYTPLQMEMITKMFDGASITVLGDANQTINPYHKYDSLEEMKEQLGNSAKYVELNKAYRSSPEIMNYVDEIIDNDKIVPIRESNNNPVVVKEVDKKELFTTLVNDLIKLKEDGFNRICIVTKSNKEAKAIYEGLKDSVDGLKILGTDQSFETPTLVAPSYSAKGLEFDAVICYNDYDNSYNEEDKYLYYVACTRAQHDLLVYNEPKKLSMNRGNK